MNFTQWSDKYYPNETKEILYKMSHAWAAGCCHRAFAADSETIKEECPCCGFYKTEDGLWHAPKTATDPE